MQCKQKLCFEQRKIFHFSSENCHFVLLKPELGGVSSIAIFNTGHKQTQLNRVCFFFALVSSLLPMIPELIQIVVSFCILHRNARRSEANPNVHFSIKTNFIKLFVYACAHGPLNKEMSCSLATCTQWPCVSLTGAVINGYAH